MWKQRMIRLGLGAMLAFSLIGWDTPTQSNPVQAQGPATFDCTAVTEIPQQECEALVALYDSTDGANWYTNADWVKSATPCSWYGVTCGAAGHVTSLELFAADGTQIAQLYGQRTEGEPEQSQWRSQIDALTPKGLAA